MRAGSPGPLLEGKKREIWISNEMGVRCPSPPLAQLGVAAIRAWRLCVHYLRRPRPLGGLCGHDVSVPRKLGRMRGRRICLRHARSRPEWSRAGGQRTNRRHWLGWAVKGGSVLDQKLQKKAQRDYRYNARMGRRQKGGRDGGARAVQRERVGGERTGNTAKGRDARDIWSAVCLMEWSDAKTDAAGGRTDGGRRKITSLVLQETGADADTKDIQERPQMRSMDFQFDGERKKTSRHKALKGSMRRQLLRGRASEREEAAVRSRGDGREI